jgi:mRNA interferase MazF
MKRGDIWTVAGGPDYAGKPRPAVILQDDAFDATESLTICPFTTSNTTAPTLRPVVLPSDENGLRTVSRLMVDKITTISKTRLQHHVGRLSSQDLKGLNKAVIVFLGLTAPVDGGHPR